MIGPPAKNGNYPTTFKSSSKLDDEDDDYSKAMAMSLSNLEDNDGSSGSTGDLNKKPEERVRQDLK